MEFVTCDVDEWLRPSADCWQNGRYLSAGERIGGLTQKAATELGLQPGIAVGSGIIDAYAGWIGTVGAKVDLGLQGQNPNTPDDGRSQAFVRLAAVAGTSTCLLAMSPKPVFVPGVWGPYRDVVIPGLWITEGGQSATGELLKYVVETHPACIEACALLRDAESIYDFLNHRLRDMALSAKAPQISWLGRHFFFYGDLYGNRSPHADPTMTGAVVGLTSDKSVNALAIYYYGAMEFIALQTREIVERMNSAGHNVRSIFISGSLGLNDVLTSLIATALTMPVVIPQYVHAAVARGAAILGAKAATADSSGVTEDLWSVMSRMTKPGKVVQPRCDVGEMKLLDSKYAIYLKQCSAQKEYRQAVDDAIIGWGPT